VSAMHHQRNLDNDFNECKVDFEPWPCPAAQAETEQRDARRAEREGQQS